MEMIYFGKHGPCAPLAAPIVLWHLHSTVLVLENNC